MHINNRSKLVKVHIPPEMAEWLAKQAHTEYPVGRGGKSNVIYKALWDYRRKVEEGS